MKTRPQRLHPKIRQFLSPLWRWIWRGTAVYFAVIFVLIVLFRWVPVPITSFMIQDRWDALLSSPKGYRFTHTWQPMEKISSQLQRAVIASEDQVFTDHYGFDLTQIQKAIETQTKPKKKGKPRKVRGASTISQQVAKNLFLWPGGGFFRKGLEAGITLVIELVWPKERILEVYLNSVEFGHGTWGAEAAARRFFKKPAAKLSAAEAALLAVSLPNPKRLRVDNPSGYMRKRQAWVLKYMSQVKRPG